MVRFPYLLLSFLPLLSSRGAVLAQNDDDSDYDPVCVTTDIKNTSTSAVLLLGAAPTTSDQLLKPSCPYLMNTTIVDTDTKVELKANRNYTYEIYFGNDTVTYDTSYRIVLCNTDLVRWCQLGRGDTTKNGQLKAAYVGSDFAVWPQDQETAQVELSVGVSGSYAVFGHVRQVLEDTNQLLSISQAIDGFAVTFNDDPDPIVLTNSKIFTITSITLSLCYAGVMVVLLVYIVRHRDHPLLKLAQAPFLAVQMICAIIAVASFFVLLPLNDAVCRAQGMLIHVPLTILAATLVGRLWRTYTVVSVALKLGRSSSMRKVGASKQRVHEVWALNMLKVLANLHLFLRGKNPYKERQYTLKTQVSQWELARLILVLSMPQIVMQLVSVIFDPRHIVVDYNSNGFIGRQTCEVNWTPLAGMIYMNAVFILAVFVAWVGRDLPSMLNEKDAIFTAGAICIVLTFVVYITVLVSASPTTNPDVISMLEMLLCGGIASAVVWLTMWPKIQRVRQGGTIVISNLLRPNGGTTNSSSIGGSIVNQGPIKVKIDQAPPRKVEVHMLHIRDLLQRLYGQTLSGTSISLADWHLLITGVDLLRNDLHRLEFDWTKEDEDQSGEEPQDEAAPDSSA